MSDIALPEVVHMKKTEEKRLAGSQSAEARAKISRAAKTRYALQEERDKLGAAIRAGLAAPAVRAKMEAPERKEKFRASIRAGWVTRKARVAARKFLSRIEKTKLFNTTSDSHAIRRVAERYSAVPISPEIFTQAAVEAGFRMKKEGKGRTYFDMSQKSIKAIVKEMDKQLIENGRERRLASWVESTGVASQAAEA
jgi:hypothetical protein